MAFKFVLPTEVLRGIFFPFSSCLAIKVSGKNKQKTVSAVRMWLVIFFLSYFFVTFEPGTPSLVTKMKMFLFDLRQ